MMELRNSFKIFFCINSRQKIKKLDGDRRRQDHSVGIIWFQYYNIVMDDKAKINLFAQQFILASLLISPTTPPFPPPSPLANSIHKSPQSNKQRLIKEFSTLQTNNSPKLLVSFGEEGSKSKQKKQVSNKKLFKKQKQISPKIVKVDITEYQRSIERDKEMKEWVESKRRRRIESSTQMTSNIESERENRNLVEIEIEVPEMVEGKSVAEEKKMIKEIETDIQKLIQKMRRGNGAEGCINKQKKR